MKKYFKIYRYLVFIGMIIFVVYTIISIRDSKDNYIIEKQRYYSNGFKGILINKKLNRGLRITIENQGKISKNYLYESKNYNYKPSDLYDFIMINDSIIKISESLDFYIIRNNEKFYFKLGEYINQN